MNLSGSSSTEASQQSNLGSTSEMEENSTTLLDIPAICLDHVLKHLELTDLTNAANSHSALTASAVRVFSVYVKHKPIVLCDSSRSYRMFSGHWRKERRPTIQLVSNRSLFSSILNHFGSKMESLGIHIEHRFILDKVIEKCSSNLTELHVSLAQNDLRLNHHFPKLHELVFLVEECNIPNSWTKINEHFPELRCLNIHNVIRNKFEFKETFIDHIPNLTRFALTTGPLGPFLLNENVPLVRRIGAFVNANKHVNSLWLGADSEHIDALQASINWEELEITDLRLSTNDALNVQHIGQLKQLRKLRVAGILKHFEILDLNQLEELDILFREKHRHPFVDFFPSCNNLKKLTVRYNTPTIHRVNSSTYFERITDTMPQLKEITFHLFFCLTETIPILYTGISALMRRRRNLHSINVIMPRFRGAETFDCSRIQNENWELVSGTSETVRFQNKMIRNA